MQQFFLETFDHVAKLVFGHNARLIELVHSVASPICVFVFNTVTIRTLCINVKTFVR